MGGRMPLSFSPCPLPTDFLFFVAEASIAIEQAHPDRLLDEQVLRRLIRHVAAEEQGTLGMLSIVLTDHDTVRALNRTYLDHDYVTDVLSFDLSDAPDRIEGEIYVDLDTAAERHSEFGTTFDEEVYRYVVHGLLHLFGYDDRTPPEKAAMRRLEDAYLAAVR